MRVRVENLSFGYTQKLILSDLSFELASGQFLSIIGKNGSGKSTLIKCLLGLVKSAIGTVYLDDIDVTTIKRYHNIGYVPQRMEFNYEFPITVKELLRCVYPKNDDFYTSIINDLDLNSFYNDNINNLSGGQLQRVFIARALLTNPKLLVLDEPATGIDIDNQIALRDILKRLKAKKITIILVTHSINFCKDISDYVLELKDNYDYSFTKVGQ